MLVIRKLLIIPLLFSSAVLIGQTRTITGKVFSTKGNASVSSATITIKGSTKGVSAASDGSFSISVPKGSVVLTVTSVGFAQKEVEVSDENNSVNISLEEKYQAARK